jgi:hypothetical protein
MNYYVLNSNQEIALFDTSKSRLQTTLKFKPELADAKIHQTTKEIVELDGKFVFADEHESELLEKAKAEKLAELSSVADNYAQYKCPIDMYITSSTGFKVDADVCSQTNMQGLILMPGEGESCQYKDFNNEFQTVTREQLTIMVGEAKQNGLSLYNQKFAFEAQINACTTIDEVNAIEIKFEMLDFPKSE